MSAPVGVSLDDAPGPRSRRARPTSGSEPAPRPLVSFVPSWILIWAGDARAPARRCSPTEEVDAGEARADHPVDGIRPAAAESDHPDLGCELPILFLEPEDELLPHRSLSPIRPAFAAGRILLALLTPASHQKISRIHSRTRARGPAHAGPAFAHPGQPARRGPSAVPPAPVRTSPTAAANAGCSTCSYDARRPTSGCRGGPADRGCVSAPAPAPLP